MINHRLNQALAKARGLLGNTPLEVCYVEYDAVQQLADFTKRLGVTSGAVLCDTNTHEIAGEALLGVLPFSKNSTKIMVLQDHPLEASDKVANRLCASTEGSEVIISVGSGTLCDLGKYVGSVLKKPVLVLATAPSMNGYTSGIAALNMHGLKRTIPVQPVTGVFADPEVLAQAPARMISAGFADFISKTSATADWIVAHALRHEHYAPEALTFYEGIYQEVFSEAKQIGQGDYVAIAKLMAALLLSGLSMLAAGASSPASGGEHLISHYLDMKSGLTGTSHDLHGAQVGVATVYTLRLWERILKMDLTAIDARELAKSHPSAESIEKQIHEEWGMVAPIVLEQWAHKKRNTDEIEKELVVLRDRGIEFFDLIKKVIEHPEKVASAISSAGGPISPDQLQIPPGSFSRAVRNARFLRNRFTVLDLRDELGLTI